MIIAAVKGDTATGQSLIKKGISPNTKKNSFTALMFAAQYGSTGVAKILLNAGANPNQDTSGRTPLELAKIMSKKISHSKREEEIITLLNGFGAKE